MDATIDQQVARDEDLVPHAKRLRIGMSNFCLLSNIKSKESTLQLVYDILCLIPFFKAFLVTSDVSEIYMQEFWATATVHHHSIRFKMDNKKHIVNLDSFREMLHICPRLPHQPFVEPPFEEEILAFLWFFGHSRVIKKLTDVEHKDTKKSNEMYYPRFMKVIIYHFMSKDPSIPRRNKVKWHYVRDDHMFSTIKLVSRHQNMQQFGALLPIELTNEDIRNSNAYKEYYAVATRVTPPKPKASVWKTRSSFDTRITPPTAATGDDDDEGDGDGDDDDDQEDEWDDGNDDEEEEGGDDEQASDDEEFIHPSLSTHTEEEAWDEESFDLIPKTPEDIDDEGNGEENLCLNSLSVSSQFVTSMLNPTPDARMESFFETTSQMDAQTPTSVAPLPMSAPTLTSSTTATITTTQQVPLPPTTVPSILLQDLPNLAHCLAVQLQSDRLREEAQKENDKFLKTIDENMQKIIKEQVKEQVNVQVSKILAKIKQTVNEQLEAEVLTRSSNSSKTSYAVAADLSEMELKKILIENMEGNKSIHQSNEQRNLYKALVEAYESDKIILDTYIDTVMLKRRRDDDFDKDEEPSVGPDRGSKRCREGKEPDESATAEEPMHTTFKMEEPAHPEFETGADDQPIVESSQHPEWFSQQQKPPTLDRDWNKTLSATHGSIQPWISELAKQSNSRSCFNELMDTPVDFSNFLINRLKVNTLTLELLAGPTYELLKGSCKSLVELEYHLEEVYKATTDQLDWFNPEGQQYPHNLLKPLPLIPHNRGRRVIPFDHFINNDLAYLRGGYDKHALWGVSHWGRKRQQFYGFTINRESARDVYSKRRIIVVTELKIVEWHNHKHLDRIMVRRDGDKLYKFKEGDFKRLRIQDIEDMLLLLIQEKLTNLTVDECFAFNVSIQMFTRSVVIQRRVEDLWYLYKHTYF
nr:hypothetical protein [Tanacetum cinerariifolium]